MITKNISLTTEPRIKFEAQSFSPAFFEAEATDGSDCYIVRWAIEEEFKEKYVTCACDFLDDEFACDWKNPIGIYDKSGNNVKNNFGNIIFS